MKVLALRGAPADRPAATAAGEVEAGEIITRDDRHVIVTRAETDGPHRVFGWVSAPRAGCERITGITCVRVTSPVALAPAGTVKLFCRVAELEAVVAHLEGVTGGMLDGVLAWHNWDDTLTCLDRDTVAYEEATQDLDCQRAQLARLRAEMGETGDAR
jgi:hypothetical protein